MVDADINVVDRSRVELNGITVEEKEWYNNGKDDVFEHIYLKFLSIVIFIYFITLNNDITNYYLNLFFIIIFIFFIFLFL